MARQPNIGRVYGDSVEIASSTNACGIGLRCLGTKLASRPSGEMRFLLVIPAQPPASPARLVEVYTEETDPKQESAIAASHTPLWLVSGWGCRGRGLSRARGRPSSDYFLLADLPGVDGHASTIPTYCLRFCRAKCQMDGLAQTRRARSASPADGGPRER